MNDGNIDEYSRMHTKYVEKIFILRYNRQQALG